VARRWQRSSRGVTSSPLERKPKGGCAQLAEEPERGGPLAGGIGNLGGAALAEEPGRGGRSPAGEGAKEGWGGALQWREPRKGGALADWRWVCTPRADKNVVRETRRGETRVDLSIFRAGPGSRRAEKNSVISGRKNPAHDHPTGRIGP
jgi:hypothetical protein